MTGKARFSLGVIVALAGAATAPYLLRAHGDADIYEHASFRGPGARLADVCRQTKPAIVERLYTQGMGRTQRLLMRAKLTDGARLTTQIPSPNFWQYLEQDAPVTIEVWRGKIMRVKASGRDESTSENPTWRFCNIRSGAIAIVALLSMMAVIVALALRFKPRPREHVIREGP